MHTQEEGGGGDSEGAIICHGIYTVATYVINTMIRDIYDPKYSI